MATLETQYKNYQVEFPESKLTFDEWKKDFGRKISTALEKCLKRINDPEYKQKQIDMMRPGYDYSSRG